MEILSNRDSTGNPGGGRAARILVADDNSNIQRMVTLALKDHGIEVVAVGNGEAAVRSIGQGAPDLILADVFMPVRSGYEVCEYVKRDSRYSHIPVVLLLGAFDPLDENEAKRVGADGVLKKPFVPPDPMIALVKALLEKSAPERVAAVPVPVPVAVAAGPDLHGVAEQPIFRSPRAVETLPPIDESPEIDYPPMGRDAFDSPSPVVASPSSEMQASAATEVEESEVTTRHRDAALGEPAFWRPVEVEQAPEEAPAAEETHGGDPFVAAAEPSPGYFDSPEDAPAPFSPHVSEPEMAARTEVLEHTGAVAAEEFVSPGSAESAAIPDTQVVEESSAATETSQTDWNSSPNDWATPAAATNDSESPAVAATNEASGDSQWPPAVQEPVVQLSGASESSFAPSSAVWNEPEPTPAPIELSSATSWIQERHVVEPERVQEQKPSAEETAPWSMPIPAVVDAPTTEPALADTQEIPEDVLASVRETPQDTLAPESPAAEPVQATAPAAVSASDAPAATHPSTEELVNAVVARVIQKLQPQIAEMINEEILRPVVSALVRKEVEKQ